MKTQCNFSGTKTVQFQQGQEECRAAEAGGLGSISNSTPQRPESWWLPSALWRPNSEQRQEWRQPWSLCSPAIFPLVQCRPNHFHLPFAHPSPSAQVFQFSIIHFKPTHYLLTIPLAFPPSQQELMACEARLWKAVYLLTLTPRPAPGAPSDLWTAVA